MTATDRFCVRSGPLSGTDDTQNGKNPDAPPFCVRPSPVSGTDRTQNGTLRGARGGA